MQIRKGNGCGDPELERIDITGVWYKIEKQVYEINKNLEFQTL